MDMQYKCSSFYWSYSPVVFPLTFFVEAHQVTEKHSFNRFKIDFSMTIQVKIESNKTCARARVLNRNRVALKVCKGLLVLTLRMFIYDSSLN